MSKHRHLVLVVAHGFDLYNGPQTKSDERWSIVNYIRVLQRAKNAKDSDIEQIQKGLINAAQ